MLFNDFKNENEFRKQFILPFLERLGFIAIEETHGSIEFGRDFVFSERHRIFELVHYAAVVKHVRKINSGTAIGEIVDQVKQCFMHPIGRPFNPEPQQIVAVLVINSGEITMHGKTDIYNRLASTLPGHLVRIFDSEQLRLLDSYIISQDSRRELDIVRAVGMQMDFNAMIVGEIVKQPPVHGGGANLTPLLSYGLEQLMLNRRLVERLHFDDIGFVHNFELVRMLQQKQLHFVSIPQWEQLIDLAKSLAPRIDSLRTNLSRVAKELAAEVGERKGPTRFHEVFTTHKATVGVSFDAEVIRRGDAPDTPAQPPTPRPAEH